METLREEEVLPIGLIEPPMEMFKGAPFELESSRSRRMLRAPMGLISPPIETFRGVGALPMGLIEPPMETFREGASPRMMARPLVMPKREMIAVKTLE